MVLKHREGIKMSSEPEGRYMDAGPPSWDAEAKTFSFFLCKSGCTAMLAGSGTGMFVPPFAAKPVARAPSATVSWLAPHGATLPVPFHARQRIDLDSIRCHFPV